MCLHEKVAMCLNIEIILAREDSELYCAHCALMSFNTIKFGAKLLNIPPVLQVFVISVTTLRD